ncbi:MAG: D-alanyl-D-alanine carboxypeptidase/D-alanyl-D-alanine-endopeptidase [Actinobacteria bacterium]|uniref:Unannotated protein n=1 Tax=freshwater metagenome TaxID=449393 RepID=A0A6J6EYU7_9ZZZZ|nr:D-alanyl-D-alanine carboxypeptidase/D-alanyl-D-alanine-endopeptidase [Actinomycetota bacterium]MSX34983.1 D-alanyl-D-alanine carboxypeptidase/D-alanyl-D-alanine-endopeptidase [Actinomycetota bacterium]MSY24288.1 D-alanyl-D-alanine carboxypeptidase/D-alanyl-D-alanine-endopeptidase [Actinomycetota bacterium]MSZ52230.1 D-alanyl-D-alanine carboxypeptidase/D-alanyl-D-alanine-endopeptidase [Actinomycetota bacterium]MTA42030.1 D-alanyl-D-alanine carboxypeptidase/D-alanyl-D-alanine-endopeptidase [Ac
MLVAKSLACCVLALTLSISHASSANAEAKGDSAVTTPTPTTPLLSARRFPGALQATASDPELVASLDQYLNKVVGTTCALVELDGRVIFSHKETEALQPASTLKLATALAALDILGPDSTFTTRFVANKVLKNGVIDGDLYVVGGGDPLLATSGYKTVFEDPDQFYEDFTTLADTLAQAGVKQISGGIVGDDSRYDATRWVASWPTRYQIGGTVAPLSALLVNDGSTGYSDTPSDPTTNRKAGDPTLLFAQTLRTVLNARGIKVAGGASTGKAPTDGKEIASFDSVPMSKVLSEMLTDSDNTTAELVTKEIGYQAKGQGTTTAGVDAIRESLTRQGFDLTGFVMLDGSGLDPGDRMACTLGLALVSALSKYPDDLAALPVGGRTGTLRKRMLATASTGRVRAKTGTLNSVNALSGFADTPQGNVLTFSFVHNGTDSRTTVVADGFTDRLMAYAKGIKVSSLGPLPVK